MEKKTTAAQKSITLEDLQKIYGLQKPKQIKMRIIWNHLQALTLETFGPQNRKQLQQIDAHFSACERLENHFDLGEN